jgi:hypothetical protein
VLFSTPFLINYIHQQEISKRLSSNTNKLATNCTLLINAPLKVGDYVEEVFGLPPLLPLSVIWQCVASDCEEGLLEFYSPDGVPRFARECRMKFYIEQIENGRCNVELIMEFESRNPIVPFGLPLLSIDNNIALKILLPSAIPEAI